MSGSSPCRHPVFARFYSRLAPSADAAGASAHRERLLAGLAGRVVEVGAGIGSNFAHYPATVTEVIAIEPEPYLRERAERAAASGAITITVLEGSAEHLPLADESVDAGVASLVLCSVPDQAVALAELRRVIRPGGELRFYEHVAATDATWRRRQRRVDPVWSWLGGGCHITRDTEDAIEAAGFEIDRADRFLFQPSCFMRLAAPHILGAARRT